MLINKFKNSHTTERYIILFIFAVFAVGVCHFQIVTAFLHNLDTAFLIEALRSINHSGIPVTQVGGAIIDLFSSGSLLSSAETVCKSALISTDVGANVLNNHAYFIFYPLALFSMLLPPHIVASVCNGLVFVSFVFITYWILRSQKVGIVGAFVFCFLVMVHPAWSFAFLGDLYADRIFMPLGLLYFFLLYNFALDRNKDPLHYIIFVVGLLASLTTERGAIMIAFLTITFLCLYKKSIPHWKERTALLFFSMVLIIYIFSYLKLLHANLSGQTNILDTLQGGLHFFESLRDTTYATKVREFLIINILLFGILSLLEWRLALIAFMALLPNLLTTIGGAEKNGWATHYHSMYFPFLVFSSAIGFSKLWQYLPSIKYRLILIGFVLVLTYGISHYSPSYGNQRGALTRMYDFYSYSPYSDERQHSNLISQISKAIPSGASVTTSEYFMPSLFNNHISYYPMGIDTSDYAILTKTTQLDGSFYYAGAISYIAGEGPKIDRCLTKRLRKAGYNVDTPILLTGDIAILKRDSKLYLH